MSGRNHAGNRDVRQRAEGMLHCHNAPQHRRGRGQVFRLFRKRLFF